MLKKRYSVTMLTGLLVMVAIVLPCFVMAQDPGGGPDVPIDGGLSLLLAAGAAYGVKRYKNNKRNE